MLTRCYHLLIWKQFNRRRFVKIKDIIDDETKKELEKIKEKKEDEKNNT